MGKPVELFSQRVLTALLDDGGLAVALAALLDIGRVAALERRHLAVVDLPHGKRDLVQEPAVVCDDEKGAFPLRPAVLEVVGQPLDGLHVEVVGGLVHKDDVPGAHKKPRQVAAAALAAGELAHKARPVQVADKLVDDLADLGVGGPDVLRGIANNGLADGLVVAQGVGLAEPAHVDTAAPGDLARVRLNGAVYDLQQGRLAVAVLAHDADAVALVDSAGQVVQDLFVRPFVAHVLKPDEDSH